MKKPEDTLKSSLLGKILYQNPSLQEKKTYEEATSFKYGFDDSSIEEAYKEYQRVEERTKDKSSLLGKILYQNPSLQEKKTYDEATSFKYGFDDSSIEEAYEEYKKLKVKLLEKNKY